MIMTQNYDYYNQILAHINSLNNLHFQLQATCAERDELRIVLAQSEHKKISETEKSESENLFDGSGSGRNSASGSLDAGTALSDSPSLPEAGLEAKRSRLEEKSDSNEGGEGEGEGEGEKFGTFGLRRRQSTGK